MTSDRVKTHKLVLIGDPAVGKTSLRKRYLGKGFKENYLMTIGADIGVERITYNNESYLFQIWDMSGQISFQAVRKLYYKNITSLLIVFDLTNIETLLNVKSWFDEYIQTNINSKISCILIGNKKDLISNIPDTLSIKVEEVIRYINNYLDIESKFFVTSALNGLNVDSAFTWIIDTIINSAV